MPGTLALEIYPQSAPPRWDENLRSAGGVVFHSLAWAEYKIHESGGEPLFCLWRDGEERVGQALAIRKPARASRLGRLVGKLSFDSPPVGRDGADFVAPLLEWCRGERAITDVELGSFDAVGRWLPGELPRRRSRCEFVLPAGAADDVWVQMRQLARRKVKRAQKADHEVRPLPGRAGARAFADVYALTEARLQRNRNYDPGFELDRDAFAEALGSLVDNGAGRLYGSYRGERLEAGVVFTTFGERAYMVYSGATDEGREAGAPFLAMFDALRDLCDSGFTTINLGGAAGDAADPGSSEHGLYQFKTRFGAEVEPRESGSLTPRPLRAKATEVARKVVRR